eukprot:SAG22_NODE_2244_length_2796_cov_2.378198_1_plen_117_part_00
MVCLGLSCLLPSFRSKQFWCTWALRTYGAHIATVDELHTTVSNCCKALSFCCARTVFPSKTVPFHAVLLSQVLRQAILPRSLEKSAKHHANLLTPTRSRQPSAFASRFKKKTLAEP